MEINVEKIRSELDKYERLLENYENCMLNVYNLLGQASSYWNDANSVKFLDNIAEEKKQSRNAIAELTSIKEVYKFILSKYEKFGRKISYNLNMRGEINTNFNTCLDSLNGVINRYSSLNLGFYPNEIYKINNQKSELFTIKNGVENLKYEIDKVFKEIEEIERQVNNKISKINIRIIKESNPNNYV